MKRIYNTTLLVASIALFFCGCATKVNKQDLTGTWKCEKLNEQPIAGSGFSSIEATFTNDSVTIVVKMDDGGAVTMMSSGTWSLDGNTIKTKLGEHACESKASLKNEVLILKPDLLLTENIHSSQYIKVNTGQQ